MTPGILRPPSAGMVIQATALEFGVSVRDIKGKKKTLELTMARQAACWMCRALGVQCYQDISDAIGYSSHNSSIAAVKTWGKDRWADSSVNVKGQNVAHTDIELGILSRLQHVANLEALLSGGQ